LPKQNPENIKLYRLIDANANRLKEGLRVIEDIMRFIADDARLSGQFKKIRHGITETLFSIKLTQPVNIIKNRQIQTDVGRKTIKSELNRKNITDVFLANCQRVKESIRVLEECMKMIDHNAAQSFKTKRYGIYHLEKRSIEKLSKICNNK